MMYCTAVRRELDTFSSRPNMGFNLQSSAFRRRPTTLFFIVDRRGTAFVVIHGDGGTSPVGWISGRSVLSTTNDQRLRTVSHALCFNLSSKVNSTAAVAALSS